MNTLESYYLSWKMHVLTVAVKANKILVLLKCTFGKWSEAMIAGYKAMILYIQSFNMHVLCGTLTSNIKQ